MGKEAITFGNNENEERKFHHRKSLILLEDVDINKMQVSSMVFSGKTNTNILMITKMMIIKLIHYA